MKKLSIRCFMIIKNWVSLMSFLPLFVHPFLLGKCSVSHGMFSHVQYYPDERNVLESTSHRTQLHRLHLMINHLEKYLDLPPIVWSPRLYYVTMVTRDCMGYDDVTGEVLKIFIWNSRGVLMKRFWYLVQETYLAPEPGGIVDIAIIIFINTDGGATILCWRHCILGAVFKLWGRIWINFPDSTMRMIHDCDGLNVLYSWCNITYLPGSKRPYLCLWSNDDGRSIAGFSNSMDQYRFCWA